jgi:hypothetical protein
VVRLTSYLSKLFYLQDILPNFVTILEIRRAIKIDKLAGVTKSLYPGNTQEFVIHVDGDYDLRLKSEM